MDDTNPDVVTEELTPGWFATTPLTGPLPEPARGGYSLLRPRTFNGSPYRHTITTYSLTDEVRLPHHLHIKIHLTRMRRVEHARVRRLITARNHVARRAARRNP